MTTRHLPRTLDAGAHQLPGGAGLTTELRRSIGTDAHTLVDREAAVDGVVRLRTRWQPKNQEHA